MSSELVDKACAAVTIITEDSRVAGTYAKAIAWLYKTGQFTPVANGDVRILAFNAGVQGANGWPQSIVADIFDVASQVFIYIQAGSHAYVWTAHDCL